MRDSSQPERKDPLTINVDGKTLLDFGKGFVLGYIGIYVFALLVGLLCAGGLLAVGFLLR